jgi:uncharacterized membrane protein HdeD (DUF308 family)
MQFEPHDTPPSPLLSDTIMHSLESVLSRHWWTFVLRGIVAMVFGATMYALPGPTIAALVLVFGAYAMLDGIAALIVGIRQFGDDQRWWATLFGGALSVCAGIVALLSPGITLLAMLWLIGGWAILRGTIDVVAAVQLRRVIEGEWLLALGGLLSIGFGLLLFVRPVAGALALITFVAWFAFVLGIVLVVCGLRLRRAARASVA